MPLIASSIGTILAEYKVRLLQRYSEQEVKHLVRAIADHRLGWDALKVELDRNDPLSQAEQARLIDALDRLCRGEPLQYVLGEVTFHGLRLNVGPGVLIPRPETEELVEMIIASGIRPERIIDIGTGSGCIALALKHAFPNARVLGLDVSEQALAIAQANAKKTRLEVEWRIGNVLNATFELEHGTDLIVSNPPYIPASEASSLTAEVVEHEPAQALFVPEDDPLLFYRAIGVLAFRVLKPGGLLWFEGHWKFSGAVGELLKGLGFASASVEKDMSGNPRFIRAAR